MKFVHDFQEIRKIFNFLVSQSQQCKIWVSKISLLKIKKIILSIKVTNLLKRHKNLLKRRNYCKAMLKLENFFYNRVRRLTEAVTQRCSVKSTLLKISQNSQKNTCATASFLIKLKVSGLQLYLKKTLPQDVFL